VRVALVFQGDSASAGAWSGTPSGLARGLEAEGAALLRLRAEPRGAVKVAATGASALVRRDVVAASLSPELARLRTACVARRLGDPGRVDAAIQVGTEFELPAGVRYATFEDMTAAQALRMPEPAYRRLRPADVAAWRARQERAYLGAAACCATSDWAAASIVEDYGIDPAKVHVVGLGRNQEPRPAERDWSVPRFLFVGRAFERKNGPAVVRAFAAVRAQVPEATLDVVGEHPPLAAPGVTGHGRIALGDAAGRARLAGLFERATCFVLPSRYEPFGIAYLEAAAAGVPSIGTTVGGAATPVGPGGVLVDPADEAALRDAMLDLARPERARALGAAALEHSAWFTWPQVARRVLDALR
jgi:glycosyltransferase involved in cell wall biosynthesis